MSRRPFIAAVSALVAIILVGPAAGSTTDTHRSKQWGLDRIQAEQAWAVTTGTGVLVAVVDTGVDLDHPDLQANIVSSGADFSEPKGTCVKSGKGGAKACTQDGAQDKNGHGTHVAGIIGAVANNGIGVAGVAPGVRILPVRVLDAEGSGSTDQIAAGIRYAADQGAKVINLSLGFTSGVGEAVKVVGQLDPVYDAIDHAYSTGAVVIFAAGNDSVPICAEPAAHPKVICVGATDKNDLKSFYSNGDASLSKNYVSAPGGDGLSCLGDIFSTYLVGAPDEAFCSSDKAYEALAGTSMAAPHVAGVAGLLVAKGLPNHAVADCINRTADDLGAPGRDSVYGYGRVNAFKAVTGC